MKLRKFRTMSVATVAVAAALTMTACGSDDSGTTETTTTTAAATTTEDAVIAELPDAAYFNDLLNRALDPAVPLEEKVGWVEGAEQDPELINQVVAAAQQNGVQVQVLDPIIDNGDGSASGQLQLTINGQPQQGGPAAQFVPTPDGEWQLAQASACQIVTLAGLTSPACPA